MLLIKILLIYTALAGALWLLSLFLYNYLYTEPSTGLSWRVPLASGIVVFACLGIPLLWRYSTGGSLPVTWQEFLLDTKPGETLEFEQVRIPEGNRWTEYRRRPGSGPGWMNFVAADGRRFPPEASKFIAVTKDKREIKFQALRDKDGYLIRGAGGVIYVSDEGYKLEQGQLGRVEINQPGTWLLSLVAFLLGIIAWVGAFLTLQFNVGHAIGLGLGLYLAWLFVIGFVF